MKLRLLSIIVLSLFFFTCGKKDEQPQTQQDTTKQQTQVPGQYPSNQTETTDDNMKKEEEKKKKDEEKKKEEEKKKKEEEKKKEELTTAQEIDFAPIFAKKCQKCHGSNLKGKLEGVPDLTSSETQSKSSKQLISIITNGKQAETEDGEDMPAWKNKLTPEEIQAAAKFVLDH